MKIIYWVKATKLLNSPKWADELKAQNPNVTAEEVTEVVRQSVADIFARVLEDAGVYKTNSEGLDQFKAFVDFVNLAD